MKDVLTLKPHKEILTRQQKLEDDKQKLLSCPFCGGKAKKVKKAVGGINSVIRCSVCNVQTGFFPTVNTEEAVKRWNTRHVVQKLKNETAPIQKLKNERGAGRKRILKPSQIEAIRNGRKMGLSVRWLAEQAECSVGTIHNILKAEGL